jgi:hypothetical protein
MVFSHRRPRQVERLIRRVLDLSPAAQVLLHHDAHLEPMTWTEPPGPRVHAIERPVHIQWGGFTQLQARLRVLRHLDRHFAYDWAVTVSGQDYPVTDLSAWEVQTAAGDHDYILAADQVAFDGGLPRRRLAQDEAYLRYAYRWTDLAGVGKYAVPVANRLARLVGRDPVMVSRPFRGSTKVGFARRTIFDEHWRCYKGSTEMALSAPTVRRVLDVLARRPELERYYSTTLFPAESLLHTVLYNQTDLQPLPKPLSFTIWEGGQTAHPHVIGVDDVSTVVSSTSAFARKFDVDVDDAVFDAVDKATQPA